MPDQGFRTMTSARQVDLLRPQDAPDVLVGDIDQRLAQRRCRPTRVARWRRLIELGENAPPGRSRVDRLRAGARPVLEPGKSMARKPYPPPACLADRETSCQGNLSRRHAVRRQQVGKVRRRSWCVQGGSARSVSSVCLDMEKLL